MREIDRRVRKLALDGSWTSKTAGILGANMEGMITGTEATTVTVVMLTGMGGRTMRRGVLGVRAAKGRENRGAGETTG
jgi:hypothetical protein